MAHFPDFLQQRLLAEKAYALACCP